MYGFIFILRFRITLKIKGVWYPSPTLYVLKLSGSCLGSSSRKWQLWLSGCTSGHWIFFSWPCEACGILVPQPGLNPRPSIGSSESQPLDCQGSPSLGVGFWCQCLLLPSWWCDKWRNTERALNLMPLQSNRPTLLLDSSASAEFSQQAKPSKAQGLEANSMPAKSLQSCPMLCDPVDCSPPGSSVHGILQARILEGVAMPSSKGSSQPRDQTLLHLLLHLVHWQAGSVPLAPPGKPPPGTNWQQFPNCGTVRPSSRQEERIWKKKRILFRRRRETT